MSIYADKTSENTNKHAAKHSLKSQISDQSAAYFIDNRPEAITQRKLKEEITTNQKINKKPTENADLQALQRKENRTGMPDNLKTGVENLSGISMDDVKVHYNSDKPAQLQALAYAQGSEIHLAPGQEKHLPHEAWHVVQQKQGRVKPTIQMKGSVNVNTNTQLENEADEMGAKSVSAKSVHRELKHVDIGNKTTVQRKGEAEALNNIVTAGAGSSDEREMRRGNNRNSVVDTQGKSAAWISYLRSDALAKALKEEVKRLYLAAHESPIRFESWYAQRKIMIEGLVYKHIQFGNCGEFSSALYGELQQLTSNQYVYKASWLWEEKPSKFTPGMKEFKRRNPDYKIKAPEADHAFVVTYPDLVSNEELKYVEASDIEDYKLGDSVNRYSEIRYKLADMDREQAMVADGWLDRKVKTLEQSKLDDSNALLTDPTKAGQYKLNPDMRKQIADWAESIKAQVEQEAGFRRAVRTAHPGSYTDTSHKGLPAVDERPAYVKAFHGVLSEQVNNFKIAWSTQKAELISYVNSTPIVLIRSLGRRILAANRIDFYSEFLHCLIDSHEMNLYEEFIKDDVIKFRTLFTEMEEVLGRDGFPEKSSEALALYQSIPVQALSLSPFSEWKKRIDYLTKIDDQIINYHRMINELEELVGQSRFDEKQAQEAELHNAIPRKYRGEIIITLAKRADKAIAANKGIKAYRNLVIELESLVGRSGFNNILAEEAELHNSIPEKYRTKIVKRLADKADVAIATNKTIKAYRNIVNELESVIGRSRFGETHELENRTYHSIPENFRSLRQVQELVSRADEAIKQDKLLKRRSSSHTR